MPRRGGRLSPYGLSSLLPPLRYGVASPQVYYGFSFSLPARCRRILIQRGDFLSAILGEAAGTVNRPPQTGVR